MLEHYFIKPDTIDRIQDSWLGAPIEQYVTWLHKQGYTARTVIRRVPLLMRFGEFARSQGAQTLDDLPSYVDRFVSDWGRGRGQNRKSKDARKEVEKEVRGPIQHFLCLIMPDYHGKGRTRTNLPFLECAPGFFHYLQEEKGLRPGSIRHYQHYLRLFQEYLTKIKLDHIRELSPVVLSAFVMDKGRFLSKNTVTSLCASLRIFLRYLYRERIISTDLSLHIEKPRKYALSDIPRSISWNDVRLMFEVVDRRSPIGKRDYAILLLLVTYGLRGGEVAALTLDDIDWKRERIRIPERKAGDSTTYPLTPIIGEAILTYLQKARPPVSHRSVFCRAVAPHSPLDCHAISNRVSRYLRKAGVKVARAGAHTLRHTCVQRLVEADLPFKTIGDYVGHRSPSSTQIYTKVSLESLREVALGDGEDVL